MKPTHVFVAGLVVAAVAVTVFPEPASAGGPHVSISIGVPRPHHHGGHRGHHGFHHRSHHHGFHHRHHGFHHGPRLVIVPPVFPIYRPYPRVIYETTTIYTPSVVTAPPVVYQPQTVITVPAPLSPQQRVVEYPHGRYELHGDGVTTPYEWVWVPKVPPAPEPPAPPPS